MPGVLPLQPFPVFHDPNQQSVQSNATLTVTGSTVFTGYGAAEISLFINVKAAPTGTTPTLQYTIQEVDPGDGVTIIGTSVSSTVITAAGIQMITLLSTYGGSIKVSWAVTGSAPSFTQVYATLVAKVATSLLTDGVNGPVAVKGPNAMATAADPALVVASSPNTITIVQFGIGGGLALPKIVNVNYNKSDGAIVANVYKRVATYTVPASFNGYLIKYVSFQNETATSRVVAETSFGSHNNNTNVFTAGGSYTSPQWVATVQASVTTAFAVGSGNVVLTVTYTNEVGTASRVGTITIPKGSALGSRWDLVLQGTDLGVRSVQSVSGTPTQVGVVSILGLLQLALHEDQSTTAQTETLYAPGAITFPTGTVIGLEYAGGTVSKSRLLDILIQLVT